MPFKAACFTKPLTASERARFAYSPALPVLSTGFTRFLNRDRTSKHPAGVGERALCMFTIQRVFSIRNFIKKPGYNGAGLVRAKVWETTRASRTPRFPFVARPKHRPPLPSAFAIHKLGSPKPLFTLSPVSFLLPRQSSPRVSIVPGQTLQSPSEQVLRGCPPRDPSLPLCHCQNVVMRIADFQH